eukprot:4946512-Pyramimonas_sp.AAC.1
MDFWRLLLPVPLGMRSSSVLFALTFMPPKEISPFTRSSNWDASSKWFTSPNVSRSSRNLRWVTSRHSQ